jgi:hypothetical protein
VKTQREFEDALLAVGWTLDGPRQTPSGWKAMIERGTVSILANGRTAEQVLEDLLRDAQERAMRDQP